MKRIFNAMWLAIGIIGGLVACANAQTNGVLREVYTGIPGSSLSDLFNAPAFPANPSTVNVITDYFEAPTDVDDNYGQRLRAFLMPPITGDYIFWIASDDASALYLSSDENPANKQTIAGVASWTSSRQWDKEESQQSVPIHLEAGKFYYVEAVMKEGTGGDNLAVRWQLPTGVIEEPIPANRLLLVTVPLNPPIITQQPTNTTVAEASSAVFHVETSNMDQLYFQWLHNSTPIVGANQASYTNGAVALTDNGSHYSCLITNALGSTNSEAATLTVIPDTVPPTIANVLNTSTKNILVIFSEPVYLPVNSNSFSLNNHATVLSFSQGADPRVVQLTTSPLALRANYTLTVNNVTDRSAAVNPITPNSQKAFITAEYSPQDIGQPAQPGSFLPTSNGYNMTAGGRDIGGTADQFQYSYQERLGNFDVRVRIQSLALSDPFAKAGLMVRESLNPNSRFASVLATPSVAGCFFEYRQTTGGVSTVTGNFPVNYPRTWLRLKRVNDLFTGFASFDGDQWQQLGSVQLVMTNLTFYFGLAVASHNSSQTTAVEFRDLASVTSTPGVAQLPPTFEPLGPCSRRTPMVISEIMYHPLARPDGKDLEYIELFNSESVPQDISGYQLGGAVNYYFPPGTVVPAGGFLVVAYAPNDVRGVYGLTNVIGGYSNKLPNQAATLVLHDALGSILLEAKYSNEFPWPAAADGAGHSLILARPSFGESDPAAWSASDIIGGSPGQAETFISEPLRPLMINELLANSDPPQLDFLELYNHSTNSLDISGCGLSDSPTTNKFVIPSGSIISPHGFFIFTEAQLGFALSSAGEAVYLLNPSGTRVLDAVKFGATATGVSLGRFPDGAPSFRELSVQTPGTANKDVLSRDIVINEIMFHPISENDDDQYLELYNKGTNAVDLANWSVTSGIKYTFPDHTIIPRGGYVVVARNALHLMANYTNLNSTNLVGDFAGTLAHKGERVTLAMPAEVIVTNANQTITTNRVYITVDEVDYRKDGRWGKWVDGGGSSLELVDPHSDNSLAPNWAESDETRKSQWVTIEKTGLLELGDANFAIDNLQVMLLGEGECLVDNIEVISAQGLNIVANSTFESGISNWEMRGNHVRSSLENSEGYNSLRCLHVRGSDHGDTGPNQIVTWFGTPLVPGTQATIRAKVRWLRGWPEILFRLHGNYLEATGRMNVPANLGTPGAPNSRLVRNAGPAIYDVSHAPVLPAANEPVVVTARVHDPDGIASVTLYYRYDPAVTTNVVVMRDDGTKGDAVAKDGIYTAIIPGQPDGTLIAFYLVATDGAKPAATASFPNDAPVRECLVRFGETVPPGSYGSYRFWITQKTFDAWSNEPGTKELHDATFVYGNFRAMYNMDAAYHGSPFHWTSYDTPTGRLCYYTLGFRSDDPMLGAAKLTLNPPANMGSDPAAQREQIFHWMAGKIGLPNVNRRFVHMFVNGVRRSFIFEDSTRPDGDFINQWFPNDANGDLHKSDDWFEFSQGYGFNNVDATLEEFVTSDGEKQMGRYRWNWANRAVKDSMNDYDSLFALVDAVNTPGTNDFEAAVVKQVDMENWMRTMAIRHVVGDWDSYGYRRGKNMYAYKPVFDKWKLLNWDISFDFGLGDGPTYNLFDDAHFDGTIDPITERMYQIPAFRRIYLRALLDIINGPFQDANVNPVMDAKYSALTANSISVSDPSSIKSYIVSRRAYIQRVIATNNAPFSITSNNGNAFSTNKNMVTLEGTAPIGVATLKVNGFVYPVAWVSVSNWVLRLPVQAGDNTLKVAGYDTYGKSVSGASGSITVTFSGPLQLIEDHVVINEIMYHPDVPNTAYIELFNTSPSQAFDLSGCYFNGVNFTFPDGTVIQPLGYLVIAQNQLAFSATYGQDIPVAGEFQGKLQNSGETLNLYKPGVGASPTVLINQVTYDGNAPWPTDANGTGASLQLIDPLQDNNRPGNWAAVSTNGLAVPQWQFAAVSGVATSSRLNLMLSGAGEVYLDDLSLVAGIIPGAGVNLLQNGNFEAPLTNGWNVAADYTNSVVSAAVSHTGNSSLRLIASPAGAKPVDGITQDITPELTIGQYYTLSYWYLPGASNVKLYINLTGAGVGDTESALLDTVARRTPGQPNSVRAPLPAFPSLWLNEVQAENLGAITDQAGERDPWLELYNGGTKAISLAGYYLTDTYTNLANWAFPSNAMIQAGQFLVVWADGQPEQATATEWHTSFKLTNTGSVALVRKQNGLPAVVDYFNYAGLTNGLAYGSVPDGSVKDRGILVTPTPGLSNTNASTTVSVFINEWMADNISTLVNPLTQQFDDWFELYNAGTNYVDISGYTLTDNPTNTAQFVIPANTRIAPHAFLLVWADNNGNQNQPGQDLHVNFKLSKNGEFIGLYNPVGLLIDSVSFGAQSSDISEGRWPDGHSVPFYLFTVPTPGGPNPNPGGPATELRLAISNQGGSITLAFEAVPGKTYIVQYKDSLDTSPWQDLGEPIVAYQPATSVDYDILAGPTQRFYRVIQSSPQ